MTGLKGQIMEIIKIRDEYIRLGQLLKLAGMCSSGVDAKNEIKEGKVQVNHQTELQRGKKLRNGDIVTYQGKSVQINSYDD